MFEYQPHFLPSSVILIGAGGTGSRLMPALSQLVKDSIKEHNPLAWMLQLPIYVFDGDVVEEKNLKRQNFMADDIGKNKAAVVARRYSMAYKIPIHAVPSHFSIHTLGAGQQATLTTGEAVNMGTILERPLIIIAVDSPEARRDILAVIASYWRHSQGRVNGDMFVIDAGNEDDFGQVKFWTGSQLPQGTAVPIFNDLMNQFPDQLPTSKAINFIPFDRQYYSNLGTSAAEKSCADLPQTLAINFQMSSLILTVAQQFLQMRKMNYDGLRFSMKSGMVTELNTPKRWLSRSYNLSGGNELGFWLYVPGTTVFTEYLEEVKTVYKKAGLAVSHDGKLVPLVTPPVPVGDIKVGRVDEAEGVVEKPVAPAPVRRRRTTPV